MNVLKIGGRRWRADYVFWGKPGRAQGIDLRGYSVGSQGRPTPKLISDRTVNLANVSALYALLHRAEPIYVGEADKLGPRLRQHLSDDLAGLWDEFTWVSPDSYSVDAAGKGLITNWDPTVAVNGTAKEIVELLELVAINFSRRGLNSQKPTLKVQWLLQGRSPSAPLTTDERIKDLHAWAIDL